MNSLGSCNPCRDASPYRFLEAHQHRPAPTSDGFWLIKNGRATAADKPADRDVDLRFARQRPSDKQFQMIASFPPKRATTSTLPKHRPKGINFGGVFHVWPASTLQGRLLTFCDAIVGLIAEHAFGRFHFADEVPGDWMVMSFVTSQQDGKKASFSICECINLRVAPSS
jgi:hypothetical protein